MRVVDFLIQLLEAHAQVLHRLAALFGEAELIELLESSGDEAPTADEQPRINLAWFDSTRVTGSASAYAELEASVREFGLVPHLEFHLWAYPHYRAFVESRLDLSATICSPSGEAGVALVDEAVASAQAWVRRLPLASVGSKQAEVAAHVPWLRFRTTVLKRIGRRPMGPVY